jgi:hypothetical protein
MVPASPLEAMDHQAEQYQRQTQYQQTHFLFLRLQPELQELPNGG